MSCIASVSKSLEFIGMIVAEEAVKLLPIFVLIYFRKVRNAHSAMLCGALAGLMFGALEAVTLGYACAGWTPIFAIDSKYESVYFRATSSAERPSR